ncbi:SHOCT domain-containing protein [Marinomonas mediterranea]|jgi:hypothetical protein|uniref:Uncharacterized protein n=1 Tax=Marinomonas mediterranea (strain ATCC 700492 / JCM 21426 / NBRC 103028 / MMB-1) TaxID=717774 RepID=F2JUY3_MARM1|nr:SHOCT domain-containing protein [Marinomonas mediterranea]ADZ91637.1 hypothetical protein Marme_2400 [Marinomonas mediterranea MMB-1]WCN09595.1 hypothetical protein GV055_12005 [Marinomonas mediterranea]WCN17738.1 hypothetical protein GV053_12115 [Marinomonas mediterranea MMB-1]
MIKRWLFLIVVMVGVSGCSTLYYPSPMLETEVFKKMISIEPVAPKEKIYRQYVSNGLYIQFERLGEDNVLYGWYTCTDCTWTRSKVLAVYDGSYLYLTYGHHEEFYLEAPQPVRQHPDNSHWSWSVIEKFQIEGRNLIKLGQIRKCTYDTQLIREWKNRPWSGGGDYDCRYQKQGSYNSIFVATIDETITGKRSSIVGEESDVISSEVRVKLQTLKELFDEGLINKSDFESKRKELLDSL